MVTLPHRHFSNKLDSGGFYTMQEEDDAAKEALTKINHLDINRVIDEDDHLEEMVDESPEVVGYDEHDPMSEKTTELPSTNISESVTRCPNPPRYWLGPKTGAGFGIGLVSPGIFVRTQPLDSFSEEKYGIFGRTLVPAPSPYEDNNEDIEEYAIFGMGTSRDTFLGNPVNIARDMLFEISAHAHAPLEWMERLYQASRTVQCELVAKDYDVPDVPITNPRDSRYNPAVVRALKQGKYHIPFVDTENAPEVGKRVKVTFGSPMTGINYHYRGVNALARDRLFIPAKNWIVMHYDTLLPLGQVRVTRSYTANNHVPLRRLMSSLEDKDALPFISVKIGIGSPHRHATKTLPSGVGEYNYFADLEKTYEHVSKKLEDARVDYLYSPFKMDEIQTLRDNGLNVREMGGLLRDIMLFGPEIANARWQYRREYYMGIRQQMMHYDKLYRDYDISFAQHDFEVRARLKRETADERDERRQLKYLKRMLKQRDEYVKMRREKLRMYYFYTSLAHKRRQKLLKIQAEHHAFQEKKMLEAFEKRKIRAAKGLPVDENFLLPRQRRSLIKRKKKEEELEFFESLRRLNPYDTSLPENRRYDPDFLDTDDFDPFGRRADGRRHFHRRPPPMVPRPREHMSEEEKEEHDQRKASLAESGPVDKSIQVDIINHDATQKYTLNNILDQEFDSDMEFDSEFEKDEFESDNDGKTNEKKPVIDWDSLERTFKTPTITPSTKASSVLVYDSLAAQVEDEAEERAYFHKAFRGKHLLARVINNLSPREKVVLKERYELELKQRAEEKIARAEAEVLAKAAAVQAVFAAAEKESLLRRERLLAGKKRKSQAGVESNETSSSSQPGWATTMKPSRFAGRSIFDRDYDELDDDLDDEFDDEFDDEVNDKSENENLLESSDMKIKYGENSKNSENRENNIKSENDEVDDIATTSESSTLTKPTKKGGFVDEDFEIPMIKPTNSFTRF